GHPYSDYAPSAGEKSVLSAILYYGYPNVTNIEGYGLTADQARCATQLAVWAMRGGLSFGDLHPTYYNAAYQVVIDAGAALFARAQSGFNPSTASISMPVTNRAYAFGGGCVRYGPYRVSDSTGIAANVTGAPAGHFIGDTAGNALNAAALPSGTDFFLYVPEAANVQGNIHIKIDAKYKVFAVYFWHNGGAQEMTTPSEPADAEATAEADLLPYGKITVTKQDNETNKPLSGANFIIQEWNGAAYANTVHPVTWNAAAKVYTAGPLFATETNGGYFNIVETGKPYSYLSNWSRAFSLTGQGQNFTFTAANTPTYARISVQKQDRNTTEATPQGDASLGGAEYGLYAAETRTHPDGTVYTINQLIERKTTDATGKLTFDKGGKLFPMKYYVKEISPSEGYLLDGTTYPVDVTHNGAANVTTRSQNVTEQVKKQAFELIKIGTASGDTEVSLLEAGFKVYRIGELSKVKDGSLKPAGDAWGYKDFSGYDFSGEPTASIDGLRLPELFTDKSGRLTSPELPYGEYVVVETTTPKGYLTIKPFLVTVTEDSRTVQPWRIFEDKLAEFYIKVVKKDALSGNIVLGKQAKYRIYDLDKRAYVTMKTAYPQTVLHGTEDNPFATDETGMLITPEKLPYGHYRLDEVTAPEGYVRAGYEGVLKPGHQTDGSYTENPSGPVYIDMDDLTPIREDALDDDILEVTQYNERQTGKIGIEKMGEKAGEPYRDGDGNLQYPHEDGPLEGVVFEVVAKEDIVSPDGSGEIIRTAGTIHATLTTDADGRAWAELPLGEWTLHEKAAPEGYLPLEDEDFTLAPEDGEKAFVFKHFDIYNVRQKLNIEIEKTEEYVGTPLAGAEFTLYKTEAGEGGKYEEDANEANEGEGTEEPDEEKPPGEFIRTASSGEDGKAIFSDLPPGTYVVRETKAPEGYDLNKDFEASVDLAYDGSDTEYLAWAGTCTDKLILISCEVDKDTIKRTSAAYRSIPGHEGIDNIGKETYRYDIDYRSTSSVFAEEYVVDDPLEAVALDQIRLEELWTSITWGDRDGLMNVWYRTNRTDDNIDYEAASAMGTNPANPENPDMKAAYPNTGYRLWAEGLTTTERHRLPVRALGLGKDEYITALRFEHGGVDVGFTSKNYADRSLNDEHRDESKGVIDLPSDNADKIEPIKPIDGIDEIAEAAAFAGRPASAAHSGLAPQGGSGGGALDNGEDGGADGDAGNTGGDADPGENARTIPIPGAEPPEYTGVKEYTGGISGNTVDWTPRESTPFYAEGAAEAEGLAPVSYLVSAVREMNEEDIVSSATSRIARDYTLRDRDQDAVVTREIATFTYETVEPAPQVESTFFDNISKVGNAVRTGDDSALRLWILICTLSMISMIVLLIRTFRTRPARNAVRKRTRSAPARSLLLVSMIAASATFLLADGSPETYAAPTDEEAGATITVEYRFAEGETPDIPELTSLFGRGYRLVGQEEPVLERTLPVTRTYTWRIDGNISQDDLSRVAGLGNVTLTPVGVQKEARADRTATIRGLPTNDVEALPRERTFEISSAERPDAVTKAALTLAGAEFELAGCDEYGLPESYTATCVYRGIETYLETHYWLGNSTYTTEETIDGPDGYVIVATYEPVTPAEPAQEAPETTEGVTEGATEVEDATILETIEDENAPLSFLQKAAVGAGIAALALLIASLTLLMARKRGKNRRGRAV
ncbi:MAG: TQXA domain-containing protein, partial [Clostridiales Family XIII bacterium]|nr:TQXA domain-containing protein [Clostridiales Family XIII bacterium]